MKGERFRIPRMAWFSIACVLLCSSSVAADVVTIIDGHPSGNLWWAMPLNVAGVLLNARFAGGYVRRALQKHEQRERQMQGP